MVALDGYRLQIPAIWLWFHADDELWRTVEQALSSVGVGMSPTDGVVAYEGRGMAIEYRPESTRLSLELTHEAGPDAVAPVLALARTAGDPDLETGNCWLWSPQPFDLHGHEAQPARRVVRAARWVLGRDRLGAALTALAERGESITASASLTLRAGREVRLEIHADERGAEALAPLVEHLCGALGDPQHVAHVTIAA